MLLRGIISGSYQHNFKKINLSAPLNLDIAKLAGYFTEFEYCKSDTRNNTITESIINRRGHACHLVLAFSDKQNDGYTRVATHYSPTQLDIVFQKLPFNLSQQLKKAFTGTALALPSTIVETTVSEMITENCRNTLL